MAKFNASRVKILVGAAAINNLEECTLTVNGEPIVVTDKDSGGWDEVLAGLKSWEMSGSGIVDFSAVEGVDEIFEDLVAGTMGSIKFSTSTSGHSEFTGTGLYTSLEIGAPLEDKCSFSFSIKGSGALVKTTIS